MNGVVESPLLAKFGESEKGEDGDGDRWKGGECKKSFPDVTFLFVTS